MARCAVIVERAQPWGIIRYDIRNHTFSYREKESHSTAEPYAPIPVVLNVVVTRRCNMDCEYCVARDFTGIEEEDLVLSQNLIEWINASPFMLLVLTGGEPLLPPYDRVSIRLIDSVKDRGIILDTNGTVLPNQQTLSLLKRKKIMLRVSMDSVNPSEETQMRRSQRGSGMDSRHSYQAKIDNISQFISSGINTSIQTVVWRKSEESLYQMIDWLSENGIRRWYLQRLIPSNRLKTPPPRYAVSPKDYYPLVEKVAKKAALAGIECVPKMDLRHNSVFLLIADGVLYTQGAEPGQKIRLGSIREPIDYFDYVSAADHASRYYLADAIKETKPLTDQAIKRPKIDRRK